jgi:hypothetical protein
MPLAQQSTVEPLAALDQLRPLMRQIGVEPQEVDKYLNLPPIGSYVHTAEPDSVGKASVSTAATTVAAPIVVSSAARITTAIAPPDAAASRGSVEAAQMAALDW